MRARAVVLLGGLLGGCHGDLFDLSPDAAVAAPDFATSGPAFYSPGIQSDLDALGCSAGNLCHGGTAKMHVSPGASDLPSLRANYAEVKARASSDAMSLLLQTTLQGSSAVHPGTRPFASTSDGTFQRWLGWIRAGDPFAPDGGAQ